MSNPESDVLGRLYGIPEGAKPTDRLTHMPGVHIIEWFRASQGSEDSSFISHATFTDQRMMYDGEILGMIVDGQCEYASLLLRGEEVVRTDGFAFGGLVAFKRGDPIEIRVKRPRGTPTQVRLIGIVRLTP
jgi:hypothetical protein